MFPRLYAVCDADVCACGGWALTDFAAACLEGGARLLQIRAKRAASNSFLADTRAIVERARRVGATVIVNDRADIARLAGADGVHVGQDDLDAAAVRTIVGADAIVGLSTHTPDQIEAAVRQPISYLAVGPVFGTATKSTGYQAVGTNLVARAAAAAGATAIPIVAIGGITLDRAPEVIASGAASLAVISDLFTGGDPAARVAAYVDRLSRV